MLAVVAIAVLHCSSLPAQSVKIEALNSSIGLSQGMVYSILQDRQGFLWFATKGGLNKFNGYTCEVFQNNPFDPFSLSDNEVFCIREDRIGRIWVGTVNGGLNIYEPRSGHFYHIGKLSTFIYALWCTPDGAVWVGTDNGLKRITIPDKISDSQPDLSSVAQIEAFYFEQKDIFEYPENHVIDVCAGTDGKIWVSTQNQIGFLNHDSGQFQFVLKTVHANPKLGANAYLAPAADGSIWVGLTGEMKRIANGKIETYPFPEQSVFPMTKMAFDASGNMYVATRKQIYRLDASRIGKPDPHALTLVYRFTDNGTIGSTELLIDRTGIIWVGTNGYGLLKYNPGNPAFHTCLNGKSPRRIVIDGKSRLWVWTAEQLFMEVKDGNPTGVHLYHNASFRQHDAVSDGKGHIWLLAESDDIEKRTGYLIKIDENNLEELERIKLPGRVTINSMLVIDKTGALWATGSESVIFRMQPQSGKIRAFDVSPLTGRKEVATVIHCDAAGRVWAGSAHGLVCGIPNGDSLSFKFYKNNPQNQQSLNCNGILSICDDPKNPEQWCWLGTNGGGLNLLNKQTGAVTHFTRASGLPNNVVYSILPDKNGHLWLSTNYGLSDFDVQRKTFRNFFDVDGLQGNEFNTNSYTNDPSGNLYFGGVNGLTMFSPATLETATPTPPVYITEIQVNGKKINADYLLAGSENRESAGEYVLNYNENQITIAYAAMDFATPTQNRFKVRLVGANNEWAESSTLNASAFTRLPPGQYRFEVMTGGLRGEWNSNIAVFRFCILPPWWRSPLAWFFYFFAAAVIIYGLFRLQQGRIRLREKLRLEQEAASHLAEVNRLKNNFFNSVTHEFRTPLTLIMEPVRQLKTEIQEPEQTYRLELIDRNARRLLDYVNQLLDLSRLEAGQMPLELRPTDPVLLMQHLIEVFQPLAQEKSVELTATLPPPGLYVLLDEQKWVQIFSNLLSNALKFTNPGGDIRVHMGYEMQKNHTARFEMVVDDSGIGIPETDLPRVFDRFYQTAHQRGGSGIGLALCKELAERMGGFITVKSKEGTGSSFTVILPGEVSEMPETETPGASMDIFQDRKIMYPASGVSDGNESTPLLLLVEDDVALRHFIRASLPPGFRIAEASNGAEGLEMAGNLVPDLIISDVSMPGMDGLAMTAQLKTSMNTSHIPVILLTARTQFEAKMEGLKSGADVYLFKPFRSDELEVHIQNLLHARNRIRDYFSGKNQAQAISDSIRGCTPAEQEFLQKLVQVIEENLDNEAMDADEFARKVFLSRSQLHRKLTALTGLSLSEFARNYRLDRAKEMLQEHPTSVADVAWRTGFPNAKYFSTVFKKRFGVSPSEL